MKSTANTKVSKLYQTSSIYMCTKSKRLICFLESGCYQRSGVHFASSNFAWIFFLLLNGMYISLCKISFCFLTNHIFLFAFQITLRIKKMILYINSTLYYTYIYVDMYVLTIQISFFFLVNLCRSSDVNNESSRQT